jgi:cellulose synthase/poly-beta-1,6-N-acetylglucosamine synthase-like glycosyltransferase
MIPWWVLAVLVFGVNFTLWGVIGLFRFLDTVSQRRRQAAQPPDLVDPPKTPVEAEIAVARARRRRELAGVHRVSLSEVAVLMPAHNEETVIQDSLEAITSVVPRENVHVVSDGSTDRTCQLAEAAGVHVISTQENLGKAGALQYAIERFGLVRRYKVVMLLDADTHVDSGYFTAALPLFDDPKIVAVAGCVRSAWRGRDVSLVGKLVSFHRQRIYALTQYLLKFGQTWRLTNATHIVPGFASLYRTDVLPHIDMNPPGLVIEDFNMTFEVYQKKLGKVGFTPKAVAVTQEPGTLADYVKQTKRWALGLWQTVRRHPPRVSLFSGMVTLLLFELLTSAVLVVLLPFVLALLLVPKIVAAVLAVPGVAAAHAFVLAHFTLGSLLIGVVIPDAVLTCLVALFLRQPRFLAYGWFFLLFRVLDATISLYALPLAWASSTGRWRSPGRRVLRTRRTLSQDTAAVKEPFTDARVG